MAGFYYIKIANGLLEPKHYQAMGEAVWLYMWLQDKCTSVNENEDGKVLGNKPIVYEEDIRPVLGCSRSTYSRMVNRLREGGYIKTIRTPAGLCIVITKTKKYQKKGSVKNEHHQRSHSDVSKTRITQSDVSESGITKKSDVSHMNSDVSESTNDVSESGIQYKTKQDYIKTIQVTNVTEPAVPKRNESIDNLFLYWHEKTGLAITSQVKANRYACSNLLKKYTQAQMRQLIDGVGLAQMEKYAPHIADFRDLQSKLNQLLLWGKKRDQTQNVVVIS